MTAQWSLTSYVKNFNYTGGEQTWTTPYTGYYKLEVWGAQGGNTTYYAGGKGGYSYGSINFSKNEKIYINVGGIGASSAIGTIGAGANGGYNGGGNGIYNYNIITGNYVNAQAAGGGGATHMATVSGILKNLSSYRNTGGTNISNEILIVAGGGGGGHLHDSVLNHGIGGSGGGTSGGHATSLGPDNSAGTRTPSPGTQTSAGCPVGSTTNAGCGGFGYGGNATEVAHSGSGGGAGWYGGSTASCGPGDGGSAYIRNPRLKNTGTSNNSRASNGYARITWIGDTL